MKDYPFVNCCSPCRIINKYTHDVMVVPCGKCSACLNHKADMLTQKVECEETKHKYAMFVTLTYDNQNVPRIYQSFENPNVLVDENGDFLTYYSGNDLERLLSKVEDCSLHVLNKKHLQDFIKRFRYYVSNYTNEKIRYYACGEYGPQHFRPHYHILFFFDTEQTLSIFGQALHKAWKYGFVNWSLSRHSTSSYCARYTTGSMYLPKIYKILSCEPFNCHSAFLGLGVFESSRQILYQCDTETVVQQLVPIFGASKSVRPWRSYFDVFYPKAVGFATLNDREVLQAYDLFKFCVGKYGCGQTLRDYARLLSRDISDGRFRWLCNMLHWPCTRYNAFQLQKFENVIYRNLLISVRFNRCVGFSGDYEVRMKFVKFLRNFYADIDLLNLGNMYRLQDELLNEDVNFDIEAFYNTENSLNLLFSSDIYKNFVCSQSWRYSEAMKHKKQNDLNKLLFNN